MFFVYKPCIYGLFGVTMGLCYPENSTVLTVFLTHIFFLELCFSVILILNIKKGNDFMTNENTENKPKKYRIFNICQNLNHPITGEKLINEEQVKDGLNHKTITRYAYILHDKDKYNAKDEKKNPAHKAGTLKEKHYHAVVETANSPQEIETIARWFNIPTNQIDIPKGRGAFMDCVEYLLHDSEKQQLLDKHLYTDEEVVANFDFRAEINKRTENRIKYGRDLSEKERQRVDVLYNGKLLSTCEYDNPVLYMEDLDKLKKLRNEYISKMPPPRIRMNYYITGNGGDGKGLLSRAIARSLYPEYAYDNEIFFEAGANGSTFEGYDGQPVIIWNDRRSFDLLQELGGRDNVFNVFDTYPGAQRQNIKYGSISLCNAVNIVNSVEPYEDFLDGLVAEYNDKNGKKRKSEHTEKAQSYRRFPIIIPLRLTDFDIMLNKGFLDDTKAYDQYVAYEHFRGGLRAIANKCQANQELARELEAKTVKPIIEKHNMIVEKSNSMPEDEDAIREEFEFLGMTPKEIEAIKKKRLEEYDKAHPYGLFDKERNDIIMKE